LGKIHFKAKKNVEKLFEKYNTFWVLGEGKGLIKHVE
jgi:hypothetical protein